MIAWANTFGVNDLVHPFQIIASFVYFGHWKGLRNKPEKKKILKQRTGYHFNQDWQ